MVPWIIILLAAEIEVILVLGLVLGLALLIDKLTP